MAAEMGEIVDTAMMEIERQTVERTVCFSHRVRCSST